MRASKSPSSSKRPARWRSWRASWRRASGHQFYNAAFYAEGGRLTHVHRKVYLPTYGLFEEQRYFAAGKRFQAFDTERFGRVGLLVCEDLWHVSAVAIMQAEEVDVLVCIINSPARGVDGLDESARPRPTSCWRARFRSCSARWWWSSIASASRTGCAFLAAAWSSVPTAA